MPDRWWNWLIFTYMLAEWFLHDPALLSNTWSQYKKKSSNCGFLCGNHEILLGVKIFVRIWLTSRKPYKRINITVLYMCAHINPGTKRKQKSGKTRRPDKDRKEGIYSNLRTTTTSSNGAATSTVSPKTSLRHCSNVAPILAFQSEADESKTKLETS